jgi:hypothetical protein
MNIAHPYDHMQSTMQQRHSYVKWIVLKVLITVEFTSEHYYAPQFPATMKRVSEYQSMSLDALQCLCITVSLFSGN